MGRFALALGLTAIVAVHADAQRYGGCVWEGFAPSGVYWPNPRTHNVPYDGRLIVARIWYSGFFAFCPASQPYSDEVSAGWAHDFPHPEQNVGAMMAALTKVHAYTGGGNIYKFDDPELLRFPIAYLTEPGGWFPNRSEAAAARNYLRKGGFLMIDDWRGPDASRNTWAALKAIFPELTPMRVPDSHAIFNSFFQIRNASAMLRSVSGQNGYGDGRAEFWGIFEDNDPRKRLMVICNVNEDIKDYWVWSSTGRDPIDISNEAYKLGINYLVYALVR